tara:strand:- start:1747 stop:3003 length:1257 start_codon:yes stop_codon:yes gene_type:complete
MAYLEGIKTTVKPTVWAPNTIYFVLQGGVSETYITDNNGTPKPVGNTDLIQSLLDQYEDQRLSIHINNNNNPHNVTKSQVGLSNVDNTSDINKPISTATQTSLDGKVDDSQVLTNVPAGAVFTDTTYDNTDFATAAQGVLAGNSVQKTGDENIDGVKTFLKPITVLGDLLGTSIGRGIDIDLTDLADGRHIPIAASYNSSATDLTNGLSGFTLSNRNQGANNYVSYNFATEGSDNLSRVFGNMAVQFINHSITAGKADYVFNLFNNNGLEEAARLKAGGTLYVKEAIGIGIDIPTERVEVNGNVKATGFIGSGSQLTGVAKTAQSDIIAATTLPAASNGEKIFLDPPAAISIDIDHLVLADKQENYFINESAFNVTFVPSVANSTNVIAANALILEPSGTAYLIRKGSENKIYLNISN